METPPHLPGLRPWLGRSGGRDIRGAGMADSANHQPHRVSRPTLRHRWRLSLLACLREQLFPPVLHTRKPAWHEHHRVRLVFLFLSGPRSMGGLSDVELSASRLAGREYPAFLLCSDAVCCGWFPFLAQRRHVNEQSATEPQHGCAWSGQCRPALRGHCFAADKETSRCRPARHHWSLGSFPPHHGEVGRRKRQEPCLLGTRLIRSRTYHPRVRPASGTF